MGRLSLVVEAAAFSHEIAATLLVCSQASNLAAISFRVAILSTEERVVMILENVGSRWASMVSDITSSDGCQARAPS